MIYPMDLSSTGLSFLVAIEPVFVTVMFRFSRNKPFRFIMLVQITPLLDIDNIVVIQQCGAVFSLGIKHKILTIRRFSASAGLPTRM